MKLQYANIPVGYVCIPVEEHTSNYYRATSNFLENAELRSKVDKLEVQLKDVTEDRDKKAESLTFWINRSRQFEDECEKLKKQLQESPHD